MLAESTVVVIGGSSGIGLACAKAAHDAGASVVITGRSESKLSETKRQIGENVSTFSVDAADESGMSDLFEEIARLDHLIFAAAETVNANIAEAAESDVRSTVDIRLWGGFYAAKHATPRMDGGSITFVSGTSSRRPYAGSAFVAASCGAIEAFARALALEAAPTRVNVIRAGIVDTPLLDAFYGEQREETVRELAASLPVGRIGKPEDIADGAMFLMRNSFVTGTVLNMDGGKLLV